MFKIHLHPFLSLNDSFRTDVIDRIRRLNDDPREEERAQVENMRQQLTSHFSVLSSMERRLNILPGPVAHFDDGVQSAEFDDIGQDDAQAATGEPAMAPPTEQPDPNLPITPEARTIQFPSNIGLIPGQHGLENSMMQYREEELTVRVAQASKFLGKIREAVAEKSFQYSHIQRQAPKKSVKTRSQTVIGKLNHQLALLSKLYGRNRARLVRLGATAAVLDRYRVLVAADVKASTALLDQNQMGSRTVALSWIWQLDNIDPNDSPAALQECKYHH